MATDVVRKALAGRGHSRLVHLPLLAGLELQEACELSLCLVASDRRRAGVDRAGGDSLDHASRLHVLQVTRHAGVLLQRQTRTIRRHTRAGGGTGAQMGWRRTMPPSVVAAARLEK